MQGFNRAKFASISIAVKPNLCFLPNSMPCQPAKLTPVPYAHGVPAAEKSMPGVLQELLLKSVKPRELALDSSQVTLLGFQPSYQVTLTRLHCIASPRSLDRVSLAGRRLTEYPGVFPLAASNKNSAQRRLIAHNCRELS